jgi:hypothetical protein
MCAFHLYFHLTSGSLADSVFAAGSYSRTVGVHSRAGALLYLLAGHKGGVTQVPYRGFGRTVYLYRFKTCQILDDMKRRTIKGKITVLFLLSYDFGYAPFPLLASIGDHVPAVHSKVRLREREQANASAERWRDPSKTSAKKSGRLPLFYTHCALKNEPQQVNDSETKYPLGRQVGTVR